MITDAVWFTQILLELIMQKQINWGNGLYWLLGLNFLMFGLSILLSTFFGSQVQQSWGVALNLLGSLSQYQVSIGEAWRLLTANFLHADLLHILSNMYALWYMGGVLQRLFGSKWLVSVYVITGVIASVVTVLFTSLPSVGASGAVFGIIGFLLGVSFKKQRYGMELPFDWRQIAPVAVYSLLIGFVGVPGINNWAHLGGLVAGGALGYMIPRHNTTLSWREPVFATSLIAILACYILLAISAYLLIFAI